MSVLTAAQTIKTRLIARKWAGNASNSLVFAAVIITNQIPEMLVRAKRLPLCIIGIGSSTADPYHHGYQRQIYNITIVQAVADESGEGLVEGGFKGGGSTSSKGRGILEIETELFNTIGEINQAESLTLQSTVKSAVAIEHLDQLGYAVGVRTYAFEAKVVDGV